MSSILCMNGFGGTGVIFVLRRLEPSTVYEYLLEYDALTDAEKHPNPTLALALTDLSVDFQTAMTR